MDICLAGAAATEPDEDTLVLAGYGKLGQQRYQRVRTESTAKVRAVLCDGWRGWAGASSVVRNIVGIGPAASGLALSSVVISTLWASDMKKNDAE